MARPRMIVVAGPPGSGNSPSSRVKQWRARRPLADAIVMASAARRGDRVLTGDVRDFQKLGAYFPAVKVLGI